MDRRISRYETFYVPTLVASDGARHILTERNGLPLCGDDTTGVQEAPWYHRKHVLCLRCRQRYICDAEGLAQGWGWGDVRGAA
jgi:hypothetical protein